jgi:hypothetical protein
MTFGWPAQDYAADPLLLPAGMRPTNVASAAYMKKRYAPASAVDLYTKPLTSEGPKSTETPTPTSNPQNKSAYSDIAETTRTNRHERLLWAPLPTTNPK